MVLGVAMVSLVAGCSSAPAGSASATASSAGDAAAKGATVTQLPPEVEAYRLALEPVLVNKARDQDVEEVVMLGRKAAGKVYPDLQRLDDERWKELQTKLQGYIVVRDEFRAIVPDPDFFLRLSMEKGRREDRDFFKALKMTRPDGIHASYLRTSSALKSCARYGEGKATEAYGYWKELAKKHPGAYVEMRGEEQEALRQVFAENTCACGEKQGVLKELESFARRFQGDPLLKEVHVRIQQVRADKAGMHYRCEAN